MAFEQERADLQMQLDGYKAGAMAGKRGQGGDRLDVVPDRIASLTREIANIDAACGDLRLP